MPLIGRRAGPTLLRGTVPEMLIKNPGNLPCRCKDAMMLKTPLLKIAEQISIPRLKWYFEPALSAMQYYYYIFTFCRRKLERCQKRNGCG